MYDKNIQNMISMKKYIIIQVFVSCIFLYGCAVKSIYPFYEKEDIIFVDNLLGDWIINDSLICSINRFSCNNITNKKITDESSPSYLIALKEKNGIIKDLFNAHLFILNDEYYVDLQSIGNNSQYSTQICTHTLAKVKINVNSIQVCWYNNPWFELLINENRAIGLKYEKIDDESYILTSSTDELHQFVNKNGDDPKAFKANFEAFESDRQKDAFIMNLIRILPDDLLYKKLSDQN